MDGHRGSESLVLDEELHWATRGLEGVETAETTRDFVRVTLQDRVTKRAEFTTEEPRTGDTGGTAVTSGTAVPCKRRTPGYRDILHARGSRPEIV